MAVDARAVDARAPWRGKKGVCREGEPARLVRKAAPAEGEQVGRLGENTSWETWQVPIHFTIMKSII